MKWNTGTLSIAWDNETMRFSDSIFASRFQITRQDLEKYLAEALSQGGDYADLYFEYLLTSSIGLEIGRAHV